MILKNEQFTELERKTYKLHLLYAILEGIVMGILVLNEFVFLKSLKGSNIQVSMVFQFSMVVMVFLIIFNEFIRRTVNKKRMLRVVSLLSRLPLLLLLFFPKNVEELGNGQVYHIIFLGILFLYYLGSPVIYPTINLLLKQNYSHTNFGKLFSRAHSIHKIFWVAATFIFGWLLDTNNFIFVYVYPITATLGIASVFVLSLIPYNFEANKVVIKRTFWQAVNESVHTQVNILRTNKPYLHFEIGFLLYGFAFMSTVAVITIYYEQALNLNYSSVAFYKNIYNIVVIALLPLFGKLLDEIDPRKFAVISYFSFILFFVFTALTQYFPWFVDIAAIRILYLLLLANIFYGLFGTTNTLLWHIGSAYFCDASEAADYQSVHLSLTGVRAIFAPALGVLFYEWFGFTATFLIAVVALILAISVNYFSYKQQPSK